MKFREFKYKRSERCEIHINSISACICAPAVSLSVSALGIRYYELLWESVGISRGCRLSVCGELDLLGVEQAAYVCLQFHALRFSRSSFHAAPQEKWASVSVREIFCYCLCILTSCPARSVCQTIWCWRYSE